MFLLILQVFLVYLRISSSENSDVLCNHGQLGRLGGGVISSYNYPFNYRHNLTCSYRIYLDHDESAMKTICFTFHRFSLESTTWYCMFDYLKISSLKYCGIGHYQYGPQDEPTANVWSKNFCWTAKGEYFEVLFSTDNNVNDAGFYATYTVQDGAITDFPPSVDQSNTAPCGQHEWTCFNRRCINKNETCNGVDNCGDNSDEMFAHARCGEQNVLACDFSKQGGMSDGFCGFSQEGGHWYRTNNIAAAYGPKGDHTNGTHGYYVYTDVDHTSSYLVSPQIMLPRTNITYCFTFWYYVYGVKDSAELKVFIGRENMGLRPAWSRYGQEDGRWMKGQVLLTGLDSVQVTFGAQLLNTFSGVALDDISIMEGTCNDDDIGCNFELNTCGWKSQDKVDKLRAALSWNRQKTSTSSVGGPSGDASSKHGDGYFLTMSSTQTEVQERRALLVSPPVSGLDFNKHCIKFKYYISGSSQNSCILRVRQWGSDGLLRDAEWSQYSTDHSQWKEASVELHTYKPFQVVIEGVITQGSSGSISVDQVALLPGECKTKSSSVCLPDQYLCVSGQCISLDQKCDGASQCPDGSDEDWHAGCPAPSTKAPPTCRSDQFRCLSDGQCIPNMYRCDNVADCPDKSDEGSYAGCAPVKTTVGGACQPGQFLCSNWKCIPVQLHCDGVDNCGDNSDEQSCNGDTSHCGSGQFSCMSDRHCISQALRCDGFPHCNDSSDESYRHAGCPEEAGWPPFGTGGIVGVCFGILLLLLLVTVLAIFLCRRKSSWCKRKANVSRNTTMSTISYPDTLSRRHPAGSFPNSYIDPDRTPGINLPPFSDDSESVNYAPSVAVPRNYLNTLDSSGGLYPPGEPPPAYDAVAKEETHPRRLQSFHPTAGLQNGVVLSNTNGSNPPSYRTNTPPDHRSLTPLNHFRPIVATPDRTTPISYRSTSPICDIPTPLDPILEHVPGEGIRSRESLSNGAYETLPSQRGDSEDGTQPRRSRSADSYLSPVSEGEAIQLRPLPSQPGTYRQTSAGRSRVPHAGESPRLTDSSSSFTDENPYATIDDVHSADSQTPLHPGCSSPESPELSRHVIDPRDRQYYASVDIVNNPHIDKTTRALLMNRPQAHHSRHAPSQLSDPVHMSDHFPISPVSPMSRSFEHYPCLSSPHSTGGYPISCHEYPSGASRIPQGSNRTLGQALPTGMGPHRGSVQRRSVPSLGVSGKRPYAQRVQYLDLGLEHLVAADV